MRSTRIRLALRVLSEPEQPETQRFLRRLLSAGRV
jgi:hypothetical protein